MKNTTNNINTETMTRVGDITTDHTIHGHGSVWGITHTESGYITLTVFDGSQAKIFGTFNPENLLCTGKA